MPSYELCYWEVRLKWNETIKHYNFNAASGNVILFVISASSTGAVSPRFNQHPGLICCGCM